LLVNQKRTRVDFDIDILKNKVALCLFVYFHFNYLNHSLRQIKETEYSMITAIFLLTLLCISFNKHHGLLDSHTMLHCCMVNNLFVLLFYLPDAFLPFFLSTSTICFC
jgi:hypothetical protein